MWQPTREQAPDSGGVRWEQLEEHWDDVEADLHERFGIDLWAPGVLDRPWPWLISRIVALLTVPMAYVTVPGEKGFVTKAYPTTRIQRALAD